MSEPMRGRGCSSSIRPKPRTSVQFRATASGASTSRAVYFRVAETARRVVGFLVAFDPSAAYDSVNFPWFRERFDSFVYIDRIAVVPAGRRRGVASLLYGDLKAFARERKVPIMACEYNLRPPNEVSRLFHLSCGFEEVGRQETEGGKKYVSLQVKWLG